MQDSQVPILENFDDNEIGYQPSPIDNRILKNYIKVIGHLFGRDAVNKIWRMLRTDNNGNLLVGSGTQSLIPPRAFNAFFGNTFMVVLPANPARKKFIVYNTDWTSTLKDKQIFLVYGAFVNQPNIRIPPGWAWVDDTWSGSVSLAASSGTTQVTIIEYT